MKKYNIELTSRELQMLKLALISAICDTKHNLKKEDFDEDFYRIENENLIEYKNLKEKLDKIFEI